MSRKNRFSKPVAFNHTNPKDQLVIKHVEGRNFSGYVKQLILADIKRENQSKKTMPRAIKNGNGGIKIVIE